MSHFYPRILSILSLLTCFGIAAYGQSEMHVLQLKSAKDTRKFLRYAANDRPVVIGHRGSVEDGFPENSLEGMQHTLRYTPAMFEIDPRLTRDSVIVLMHDATIDRTTTGKGKVSDYTYAELMQFNLKDRSGNPTSYKIPRLEDVIVWARGKTILNLDQKGVPYDMILALIKKLKAESCVMITTHSAEHLMYYHQRNPEITFEAHIKSREQFDEYEKAGVPFSHIMAYIGPHIKEENKELYRLLNGKGVMAMISSASSYDKLPTAEERAEKYKAIIEDGSSALESDFPIEVSRALKEYSGRKGVKNKYVKVVRK